MECIKCGHEFEGNYCPQCGQKVLKGRISVDHITEETFSTMDIGRSFFKVLVILFSSPGASIRGHIQRTNVLFSPFKLLLIIGAVSTFTTATLFDFSLEGYLKILDLPQQNEYGSYSGKYFTFTNLVGIPLAALSSLIIFLKEGLNYFEHLVLNIYIACGQMLIIVLFGPLNWYLGQSNILIQTMFTLQVIYMVWVYLEFFNGMKVIIAAKCLIVQGLGLVLAFFTNYLIFRIIPTQVLDFFEIF